ncbi:MAG: hypothetical protein PHH36_04230 [Sideroxydans sp.]|nr:hypothetical protein [Sideroxydans sp.]
MRTISILLGLLLAGTAQAQTARCRFLEQVVLMQYGLAEGQACHRLYTECLARPFVEKDPMPKTRCIETTHCGARFWVPTPSGVANVSNLEIFKQECEPE